MERDQSGIELAFTKDISTHTLTWSVTSVEFGALLKMLDFNSHAHVERDLLVSSVTLAVSQFQLTRSRGA